MIDKNSFNSCLNLFKQIAFVLAVTVFHKAFFSCGRTTSGVCRFESDEKTVSGNPTRCSTYFYPSLFIVETFTTGNGKWLSCLQQSR